MATNNILITGGAGFLGPMLAARLLQDPSNAVVLTDLQTPPQPAGVVAGSEPRLERVAADLTKCGDIDRLLAMRPAWRAIFLFHGIMSVGCEENPGLSVRVNLEATQAVLAAVSALPKKPRVVYASTQAVYGPPYTTSGAPLTDDTPATPVGVYGTHKLITELHINDLHRRGLLDAFSVRLPTVTVRPGAPSRSAAAFLSGIVREPMAGLECVVPVTDRAGRQVICSPRVIMENFMRVMDLPAESMPPHIRAVYMPGISVTLGDMYEAFEKVCGKERLGLLREERDEQAERLLNSWPQTADFGNARRLGLLFDESCVQIFQEYVDSLKP
ncbi:NAD(P)-binding protein [Xylariaceae sp. FL0804]|nr:NAD(P)-binding protein [Xylariaceae sp. FL0804]